MRSVSAVAALMLTAPADSSAARTPSAASPSEHSSWQVGGRSGSAGKVTRTASMDCARSRISLAAGPVNVSIAVSPVTSSTSRSSMMVYLSRKSMTFCCWPGLVSIIW